MAVLACPNCGSSTDLATIESAWMLYSVNSVRHSGLEYPDLDWGETSETLYDTAQTIGVHCRACLWDHEGADWPDHLVRAEGDQ